MDHYPVWLGRSLIDDSFPWTQATRSTLPDFLAAYTVHDSYWLGWYVHPNQAAVAVIHWDTWHTSGRVPFPGSVVAHWPLLLVRVERLYQLHMNYGTGEALDAVLANTIEGAESATLLEAEREAMLEYVLGQSGRPEVLSTYLLDAPIYRTVFQSIGQGQILAIHGGTTQVLCLSREREVVPMPGLAQH